MCDAFVAWMSSFDLVRIGWRRGCALVFWLEDLIGARRCETGSPWRKLTSRAQAVMLLVWLAKCEAFAQVAAHFGVATDTAWRYVNEGLDLLAPPWNRPWPPPARSVDSYSMSS
ncbi:hypothetical protein GL263_23230 [Streptomyces durbertensis]|uniref:Transposase n=1 Tax=Streptomyces durbertensis TaxID=2448886 RepID=A0ABR6EM72_9ACTN|nr:hypothetical protein [Streptomyces durbertensis]MBB1246442.1 hypothetical protein [Streptomyces durbertensis]